MATPPPSDPSWKELVRAAHAEAAPGIDVRAALRRQILTENAVPVSDGLLDEVFALIRGSHGVPAFATLALAVIVSGWLASGVLQDLGLLIQFQNDLLTGL